MWISQETFRRGAVGIHALILLITRIVVVIATVAVTHGPLQAESDQVGADENAPRVPPWDNAKWIDHAGGGADFPLLQGSFRTTSILFAHPTLRCDYIVPSIDGVIPCGSATDIVIFFPYPGQVVKDFGPARRLASHFGFSVLSIYFPQHAAASPDDLKNYYIYPGSGSGDAWLTAISGLRLVMRLPVRKVFSVGYSAGASAAQQFSSVHSDYVEAGVFAGGRTFVQDPPFLGPTILMHSDLDRQDANTLLEKIMREKGAQPLHFTYPPNWSGRGSNIYWFHNVDDRGWELGSHWLAALANLRAKNGGVLPQAGTWMRHAGMPLPSKDLAIDVDAMPKAPEVLEDPRHESRGIIITPPAQVVPRGSAFIIDHRFGTDKNELLAISQTINLHGVSVIAQAGPMEEGGDMANLVNARCAKASVFVKPRVLVLISPSGGDVDVISSIQRIDRIVLLEPGRVEMDAMTQYFATCRTPTLALAKKSIGDRNRALFPPTRFTSEDSPEYGYKNIGDRYEVWTALIMKAFSTK